MGGFDPLISEEILISNLIYYGIPLFCGRMEENNEELYNHSEWQCL
jgi:hypothetical protein